MTDRTRVNGLIRDIYRHVTELHDHWHFETSGEAWPPTGEMTFVTGGGRSDPTGTVATTERPSDAERIISTFEHVERALRTRLDSFRSRHVTDSCHTDGCDAPATHGRRCDKCDQYARRFKGAEPPQKLVAQWNAQRPKDCACSTDCCPDGCWDRVAPGDGRVSGRCRKRQFDARQKAS